MIPPALADFMDVLTRESELARVRSEIDSEFELPAIVARVAREFGPALWFERVRGHTLPVAANLLGSERRLCLALGLRSLGDFRSHWEKLAGGIPRAGWWEKLLSRGAEAGNLVERFSPKSIKAGVCQQVVKLGRDVDLLQLPAWRSDAQESCRSLGSALLLVVDPESARIEGVRSPLLVMDRARLGLPWHPFSPLWRMLAVARTRKEKLPVAVVCGGPPTLEVFSQLPLPTETGCLTWAGIWNGEAVQVARCRTQPLEVPADAELILEGYLDPAAEATPLPRFLAPSGVYAEDFPGQTLSVTAWTQRAQPTYWATFSTQSASETTPLGRLAEQLLLPVLQERAPEIVALSLPGYGAGINTVIVSLRCPYPGAAHKVAHTIWGHEAFLLAKTLILVDEQVDVGDPAEVWRQLAALVSPERDASFPQGPRDPFDFSAGDGNANSRPFGFGGKWVIDATSKPSLGAQTRLHGRFPENSPEIAALAERRWEEIQQSLHASPATKKPKSPKS